MRLLTDNRICPSCNRWIWRWGFYCRRWPAKCKSYVHSRGTVNSVLIPYRLQPACPYNQSP